MANRLMAHFPCSDSPEIESISGETVWAQGPLDGKPPGAVYRLDVVWDSADRVRPFILSEARALGLSVDDEHRAEVRLTNGRVLSLQQTTDVLKGAEQAYREGKYEDAFATYSTLARDGIFKAQLLLGS